MITFPNCKINIGLHVSKKRDDGYHDLETVFFPVDLHDILEVVQLSVFTFTSTGLTITGDEETNLCVKAYHLLKKDFPVLPHVHIHLHKSIPMGAGLGGGSADASFMLMMLKEKFKLAISHNQLSDYALKLGSDCPFFLEKKSCFATGRGEILEPVDLDLSAYKLILVNPGIHIATKEAFDNLKPMIPAKKLKDIIQQPVETWKENLQNDFEEGIFNKHPEISAIKEELYNLGAVFASMTGTGSTVYGLFDKHVNVNFNFPAEYFTRQIPIKKV